MFDAQEILRQLDCYAGTYEFPMLDNGYYYHGNQKLTIFRDENRWAMLIETLAYFNHESGIEGITLCAGTFGNCILYMDSIENNSFFHFVKESEPGTFISGGEPPFSFLNPKAKSVLIKDKEVSISSDLSFYSQKGIILEYEDKIQPYEFMRGLIPEQSELFWLTREEISKKIPLDIPVFMTLYQWHHPDLADEEMPSETGTFQQLANVIVTGDKSVYNTKEIINTHWSNWPVGGTL